MPVTDDTLARGIDTPDARIAEMTQAELRSFVQSVIATEPMNSITGLAKWLDDLKSGGGVSAGAGLTKSGAELAIALGGVLDTMLASPNNAVYRSLQEVSSRIPGTLAAGTYGFSSAGGLKASGTSDANAIYVVPLIGADFTVPSKTTKLRVRAQVATNNTAPGITITVGLHEITASAGGADVLNLTMAGAEAGSPVAFVTPAANTQPSLDSGDFDWPGDGLYALGIVTNGANAANARPQVTAQLQARHT